MSRPSFGHLAVVSQPSLGRLAIISQSCLATVTRLTCFRSGRFCVIFVWLLADHLSDQPRLVGCLDRALSVAFEESLGAECFYSQLSLSLYPVVPNTLQDEVVTKTQASYQDHKQ